MNRFPWIVQQRQYVKPLQAKAQRDWFYIKTTGKVPFFVMTLHPKAKYGSIAFIQCLPYILDFPTNDYLQHL